MKSPKYAKATRFATFGFTSISQIYRFTMPGIFSVRLFVASDGNDASVSSPDAGLPKKKFLAFVAAAFAPSGVLSVGSTLFTALFLVGLSGHFF